VPISDIGLSNARPTGTYVSPTSPTAFTLLAGSSNQVVTIGSNSSVGPIMGYRSEPFRSVANIDGAAADVRKVPMGDSFTG
jgi:hypothetical protein